MKMNLFDYPKKAAFGRPVQRIKSMRILAQAQL